MRQRRNGGRRRWAVAAAAGLLIASVAAIGRPGRPDPGRDEPRTDPAKSVRARVVAPGTGSGAGTDVRALLDRRAQAVLDRNRAAFLATVDPDRPGFRVSQAALFDALADVPLVQWSYDLDADSPIAVPPGVQAGYGAPTWAPGVSLRYAVADFDGPATMTNQGLTFVRRPVGWLVGSDRDFDGTARRTVREPWDFGPVSVSRGKRTLVVGHPAAAATMPALAAEADADIPAVTAVWGPWAERVVLVVPADADELAGITGRTGNLSDLAAVAATGNGRRNGDGARIVLNPAPFARLSAPGRRVVLTHELTHVAAGPTTGPAVPTWLAEGLADYVAYRDGGVGPASAASELSVDLRAGGRPATLPADGDFDGPSAIRPQQYGMSWLACRLIVQHQDEATLLRFYRAVGAARDVDSAAAKAAVVAAAMRTELSTTVESFTTAWQRYLTTELT